MTQDTAADQGLLKDGNCLSSAWRPRSLLLSVLGPRVQKENNHPASSNREPTSCIQLWRWLMALVNYNRVDTAATFRLLTVLLNWLSFYMFWFLLHCRYFMNIIIKSAIYNQMLRVGKRLHFACKGFCLSLAHTSNLARESMYCAVWTGSVDVGTACKSKT